MTRLTSDTPVFIDRDFASAPLLSPQRLALSQGAANVDWMNE